MKKDIFISYTTKDKGVADVLVEYLEGLRYSCFIAPRDIDPGKAYAANLMTAISDCKLVLLVASEAINDSEHCLNEVDVVTEKKKPILPIFIEEFSLNDDYRYYLGRKQHIFAYPESIDAYFAKIVEGIEPYCPKKASSKPIQIITEEEEVEEGARKTIFEYIPERGIMINPEDHQRNVSFRNDTLINLMGGIYEKVAKFQGDETAEEIFYSSGYSGGTNFGERIKNQWNLGSSLEEIKLKLNKWCKFDSAVGWGKFSIELFYDEENDALNGKLSINEAFIVDKVHKRKICGFIRGYCTGVIETLLDLPGVVLTCKDCPLKSMFKSVCVFEFSIKG
ncbi:MAG: toll/interleukin-1 receptor domain-containing protein [Clostridia bacterium]|nr:toll/interleukin-1 receptor domain-containing protein [Clostridia bacterium]